MINIIDDNKNELKNIAKITAEKIGELFKFENAEELRLNYYLLTKAFTDSLNLEMATLYARKRMPFDTDTLL